MGNTQSKQSGRKEQKLITPKKYSYHTFLYPMLLQNVEGKIAGVDEVVEQLDKEEWQEINYSIEKHKDDSVETIFMQRELIESKALQRPEEVLIDNNKKFFLDTARKVIYEGEYISKSYRLKKINPYVEMEIIKQDKKYILKVCNIIFTIYNTGVGILKIELLNSKENQANMASVLKINEYGRRVYAPYKDTSGGCNLIADAIYIKDKNKDKILYSCDYKRNETMLNEILLNMLGNKFYMGDELKDDSINHVIKCKEILDDRMFTLSIVKDDEILKEAATWHKEEMLYGWEKECLVKPYDEQSKLYDFIFIDGDGISCIDRKLRHELLKQHLNTRWLGYGNAGTLYGITQHSMVALTTDDIIIGHFINMYTEMSMLVLAQRASIISLANRAGIIARKIKDNHISDKECDLIIELQKRYVCFQNEILLFEVTAQEQGIELYKALQKFLFINEEKERLEMQIHNLFEIAQMHKADNTNKKVIRLTRVTIALTVCSIVLAALALLNKDELECIKQFIIKLIKGYLRYN